MKIEIIYSKNTKNFIACEKVGEEGFELSEEYRYDNLSPTTWPPAKYHTNLDYPPTLRMVLFVLY